MFITKIWRSVAGQLSDRPKIFEGQSENLPVLSDSPAVSRRLYWVRQVSANSIVPDQIQSTRYM